LRKPVAQPCDHATRGEILTAKSMKHASSAHAAGIAGRGRARAFIARRRKPCAKAQRPKDRTGKCLADKANFGFWQARPRWKILQDRARKHLVLRMNFEFFDPAARLQDAARSPPAAIHIIMTPNAASALDGLSRAGLHCRFRP
jgi:hypothetical protein